MNKPKTIGILGGMGPAVRADFPKTLIEIAQEKYGAVQDTDFPRIWHFSMGMEGFDETGISDEAKVLDQLIHGVRDLERVGADFIVIPCNTVHHFYREMSAAVEVPILNILELTAARVTHSNYQTVGVLSSETTNRLGLYDKALDAKGLKVSKLGVVRQQVLNGLVAKVMAGTQDVDDKHLAEEFANTLIRSCGAEALIIGCTEIPFLLDCARFSVPVYDSLAILAEETIKFAYGE